MGDYRSDFTEGLSARYESMGTSLGLGKFIQTKLFLATLSSGLSMDLVIKDGDYIQTVTNSNIYYSSSFGIEFGLPIRMSLYLKSKWIGIGFHSFYKFTLYDSYGSIGLSIVLGNFKI